MDEELWDLKFGIEVSARYHDWRRGTFEGAARLVRAVTLAGAIVTLLTAFNPLQFSSLAVMRLIAVVAVIMACINLVDLAWDFNGMALRHTELYRRFKELQEKVARGAANWQQQIGDWDAEAQAIRRDEPPTMWAIYATCWNQTIVRYEAERRGYLRPVSRLQFWLRNVRQFRPQDFPASG